MQPSASQGRRLLGSFRQHTGALVSSDQMIVLLLKRCFRVIPFRTILLLCLACAALVVIRFYPGSPEVMGNTRISLQALQTVHKISSPPPLSDDITEEGTTSPTLPPTFAPTDSEATTNKPTDVFTAPLTTSRRVEGEMDGDYLRFDNFDLTEHDMKCENETCVPKGRQTVEQAKRFCETHKDHCQAFVLTHSKELKPKRSVNGKMEVARGTTLFVKKTFSQGLILPQDMCVVPVAETLTSDTSQGCELAEFDPFDPSMMQFVKPPEVLKCPGQRLTKYQNGVVEFYPEAKQDSKETKVKSAHYFPITRIPENDWEFNFGNNITLDLSKNKNPVKDEFIKVDSKTIDGKTHTEFHAAVVPKPEVLARPLKDTGIPLNVVMVGFDSISHAHFQRVFKEEYKFLKQDLRSIFMKGYSIVGDGTTPALTAFLTGQFEAELPEARRGFKDSDTVDRWPWVFADYKSSGYATLFSEDCPGYGAWNYRLHGFKHPPTDHFSRYFWQAAKMTRWHCIHSKPQHQVHLDYIESFFEAYPKRPKFGVGFFTDLSHNNINAAFDAAGDLLAFYKKLHQANYLNNTILITFGDHGFRYGEARSTLQGHLEERLPFLAFTFPYWFESEYPDLVENLRENSNAMTSPFDLHATLKHIITYPESPSGLKRGTSMFDEIPKSRACKEAGVADHYCPCLNLKPADPQHRHIIASAQAVLAHINNLTSSDAKSAMLCERLTLKRIITSNQQMANTKFEQFLGSADMHGRAPKFAEGKVPVHDCNYRIQIETSPGDGLFDVAVRYMGGEFRVAGDISRINKYGEQPRCILDSRPDLRKYCLCKDYVAKTQPSTRR